MTKLTNGERMAIIETKIDSILDKINDLEKVHQTHLVHEEQYKKETDDRFAEMKKDSDKKYAPKQTVDTLNNRLWYAFLGIISILVSIIGYLIKTYVI